MENVNPRCAIAEFAKKAVADGAILFVHVMGGQPKSFFERLARQPETEVLRSVPLLRGIWSVFSWLPSWQGLVRMQKPQAVVGKLLEPCAGTSMIACYKVPGQQQSEFLERFDKALGTRDFAELQEDYPHIVWEPELGVVSSGDGREHSSDTP
jgi:hypothetical protein